MKTHSFDKAPRIAQANAMFVGATSYSGIFAIFHTLKVWFQMVSVMKKIPGYCRHFIYYDFPFTLGTIAFFEDQDALLKFARSKHHRELMIWVTDGKKNADGGYIRLYNAQPEGYSNGRWRSEGDDMQHIEHFSSLSHEKEAPLVNSEARKRGQ